MRLLRGSVLATILNTGCAALALGGDEVGGPGHGQYWVFLPIRGIEFLRGLRGMMICHLWLVPALQEAGNAWGKYTTPMLGLGLILYYFRGPKPIFSTQD